MFFPGFKLMARETGGSTRLRSASPLLVRYARASGYRAPACWRYACYLMRARGLRVMRSRVETGGPPGEISRRDFIRYRFIYGLQTFRPP